MAGGSAAPPPARGPGLGGAGGPRGPGVRRRAGLGGRPPPSARGSTCEHGTHQLTSLC